MTAAPQTPPTASRAKAPAGTADQRPPGWAVASSLAAPVVVIAAWTVAAAVQLSSYDAVHQTISALARYGAAHRQIMTAGLAVLGIAHVVTAAGLRAVGALSRVVLAAAGVATFGVSVFAQPDIGSSAAHTALATVGFVLLALWPASTVRRRTAGARPPVLRPVVGVSMSVVSAALLIWFGFTLNSGPIGVTERLLVAQQALWPLVVVLALRNGRSLKYSST